jgi:hypothetical protein
MKSMARPPAAAAALLVTQQYLAACTRFEAASFKVVMANV